MKKEEFTAAHGVAPRGAAEPGGVPEGEGQDPRGGAQRPTHATHARPPKHGIGGPDMKNPSIV